MYHSISPPTIQQQKPAYVEWITSSAKPKMLLFQSIKLEGSNYLFSLPCIFRKGYLFKGWSRRRQIPNRYAKYGLFFLSPDCLVIWATMMGNEYIYIYIYIYICVCMYVCIYILAKLGQFDRHRTLYIEICYSSKSFWISIFQPKMSWYFQGQKYPMGQNVLILLSCILL